MSGCWKKFVDFINGFLVYDTVSVVRIKDKRLALLHYACLVAIVFYIVFWTIFYKQAYYAYEAPVGTVRINPMAPPERTNDSWIDIKDLPYCRTDSRTQLYGFDIYDCKYYDSAIDVFPQAVDGSITISTRIKLSNQYVVNPAFNTTDCVWIDDPDSIETFYLADIERFTLQVDHTFFAPTLGIQGNARDLPGSIINISDPNDPNISELLLPDVEVFGKINKTDIISVGTLLHAAGVNIDEQNISVGESIRYSGAIFLVILDYQNSRTIFLQPNTHYTLHVQLINNTEYKAVQAVYTKKLVNRTIYNRHGLHFVFLQTGKLVQFDFQVLLLSFVSGMGLLAMSTTVVDFISTKILGSKEVVSNLKYRTTTNLTQLTDEELMLLATKLRRTQEQELALNCSDEERLQESSATLRKPLVDRNETTSDD